MARYILSRQLSFVIVNSTTPIGEGDRKPHANGEIIVDFLQDTVPLYLETGLNIVDVRDIARSHLAAVEHGRSRGAISWVGEV